MRQRSQHTWPAVTIGLAVATILAAGGLSEARTSGNADTCWPLVVPKVITHSGSYCLQHDATVGALTGAAVEVRADDVVIDLRGHRLENTAGPGTRAVGVFAIDRKNVMVRNGVIRGFRYGVLLSGSAGRSQGHVVDSLLVRDSRDAGIVVSGAWSLIWRNTVYFTHSTGPYAVGISQAGSQTTVVANTVVGTTAGEAGGYAAGIDLTHGYNIRANGNRVADVHGGDVDYGIRCGAPFANENHIWRASTAFSNCVSAPRPKNPYPYPIPYPFTLAEESYPY